MKFFAKLQASRDDSKFGFGSRPTKLEVLDQAFEERPQPALCPHGNKPEDCNACYVASDMAYDAAR